MYKILNENTIGFTVTNNNQTITDLAKDKQNVAG